MRTLSLLSLACVLGLAGCGGNCCPKDGQKDACCPKESSKCAPGCQKACCKDAKADCKSCPSCK